MKPSVPSHRLLLVAADTCFTAEVLEALHQESVRSPNFSFELTSFLLDEQADFFGIFVLLEKLRRGFFTAVHLVPPASTWSRARHRKGTSESPLRSREEPLGLSSLSPQEAVKVFHANRAVEICTRFLEQATQCSVRKVGIILVFPEDLGGHIRQGPASIWDLQELRRLDGSCDVQRGAAYMCCLASADSRRPIGMYTNLTALKKEWSPGWPVLAQFKTRYEYKGPLLPNCSCGMQRTANDEFHTSVTAGLGSNFWVLCVAAWARSEEHSSLRDGDPLSWRSSPSASSCSPGVSLGSSLCVSLSSWSGSAVSLYDSWVGGTFTRSKLAEFAGNVAAAKFFSSPQAPEDVSKFCDVTMVKASAAGVADQLNQRLSCSVSRRGLGQVSGGSSSSSPFGSATTSSISGITTSAPSSSFKGPLVAVPSRGDGSCDGSSGYGVAGAVNGRLGTR